MSCEAGAWEYAVSNGLDSCTAHRDKGNEDKNARFCLFVLYAAVDVSLPDPERLESRKIGRCLEGLTADLNARVFRPCCTRR